MSNLNIEHDLDFFEEAEGSRWADLFEEWRDHIDSQAEWREALQDPDPFFDRHPLAFQKFWRHFCSDRQRNRSTIRRGESRAWYPNKKSRYIRFHVARHLDGWHDYWVGMPYGERTRTVTLDLDNHDDWLTKGCPGLSVPYLQNLKRLHDGLARRRQPWLWGVSSRNFGVHVLGSLGRPQLSADVHERYKALVQRSSVNAEVYPMGDHNHRLPFGRNFVLLGEEGPLTDPVAMIERFVSDRVSPSWEAIYKGLLSSWLDEVARHPEARQRAKVRLEQLNEWEYYGFETDKLEVKSATRMTSTNPGCPSIASESWEAYRESFGKARGSWVRMVQDLAIHGLPVADCLFQAVTELAKWLLFVELADQADNESRTTELMLSWVEDKNNGNVSRIESGRLSEVKKQVDRIVKRTALSEDFNSAFANMRAKRENGKYIEGINITNLLEGQPAKRTQERPDTVTSCITYTPDNLSIPVDLKDRLKPFAPKRKDAQSRQLAFSKSLLTYLETNDGEAELSQKTCETFGLKNDRDQDRAIKALVDARIIQRMNVARKGTRQTRRYRIRTTDHERYPVQEPRAEAPGGPDEESIRDEAETFSASLEAAA